MTSETRTVPISGKLDLRRVLRPLHGQFLDDGWWLAARTPDGPGSLRIRRSGEEVIGDGWGEGGAWLLDRLGAIAGLGDDPSGFSPVHPLVSGLHRRNPGYRFGRTDLVFDALVSAVCSQKVTFREARMAMHGLIDAFSEPAPGPNPSLRLPPDPASIAAAPYSAFHPLHLEKRRADTLRRVAAQHKMIEELAGRQPSDAAFGLIAIDGIGPWTAAKTLVVSHGDPDQVPVGDFHIKHMVAHHLTGKDRGTDEEMMELLEPFRPHRGRVVRLLQTLGYEPRFGPRIAPRNIADR